MGNVQLIGPDIGSSYGANPLIGISSGMNIEQACRCYYFIPFKFLLLLGQHI